MPTALSLLGVPIPAEVQGANLMPLARGEHLGLVAHSESWYPRYHYGWSELRSIQDWPLQDDSRAATGVVRPGDRS
jgi:arylsulfatase A-like enzyme